MANSVYEDDKTDEQGVSSSGFSGNSTSGSRTSFNRGSTDSSPARSNLKQAEESAGGGTSTASGNTVGGSKGGATSSTSPENQSFYRPDDLADKESSPDDSDDGFYNPSADSNSTSKLKAKFQITRRRAIGGGIAGVFIGVVIGGFSIIQGPMQFVHFGQLLQKFHLSRNEDFGDDRTSKVLLYAILGKGAERGRLGVTTNKAADAYEKQLLDRFGIRPVYTTSTGRFAGFEVVETNDGRGLNPDGKAIHMLAALQEQGKVVVRQGNDTGGRQAVRPSGGDPLGSRQLYIDIRGPRGEALSSKQKRAVIRAVMKETGRFKLAGGMGARLLIKRAGINFHFFTNEKLRTKIDAVSDRNEELKRREDYNKGVLKRWSDALKTGLIKTGGKNQESRDLIEQTDKEAEGKTPAETKTLRTAAAKAAGPAAVVGIICAAKSLGDDAEGAKYTNNVLPMMRMGMGIVGMGNQVMSGQSINLDELGAMNEQLYDEETKTSWTTARSVQAELGKPQTGPDMPKEAKLTSVSDKGDVFEVVDFITSIQPIGLACTLIDKLSEVPGLAAVSAVLQAAIDGPLGLAGTSSEELMGDLIGLINGDSVNPLAKGAELGNLANAGTFLAANDQAIATGGTALSDAEVAQLDEERRWFDGQDQSQKSFLARYFDPYDHTSLAGGIIDTAPSASSQVASLTNPLQTFGSSLSSLFSSLAPRAQAANKYNYGTATYGFSLADQESDTFENPYDNAAIVEPQLAALNEKYSKCFGVSVDEAGVLNNKEAVNVFKLEKDGEYAACRDDKNQEMFKRYRFYIADTITAKTQACYEGDEQACSEIGAGGASTDTDNPTAAGEGAERIAAVTEQEYEKNGNKPLESCGPNCGPEVQKYTGGPSGPSAPWCAWFVSWVYREAGYEFKGPPAESDGNIPAVANLVAWFKQHGIHFTPSSSEYKPQPGDVIMYGGDDHTGIVVKVNGDNIETVEGNTSGDGTYNAEGGTVGRKSFNYKTYSARSIEFGRLKEF